MEVMYNEGEIPASTTGEEQEEQDKTCHKCGLRQYGENCANCDIPLEEEKKKDDDLDEYDWRERR